MKLSNKILLGFLGFIFLYITAAFVEVRVTGTPNVINDKNSIAETVDITGIAYLVINDIDKQVNVVGSNSSLLEVRSFSGNLLTKLKYKVSGDTLTLSGFPHEDIQKVKISVFVPESSLKGITVNSSVAMVQKFQSEVLHISQNSGSVWMSDSRITKIEMDLSQSYLNISGTNLDTLAIRLERSNAYVLSPVGLLQGSIKNNSYLRMDNIEEIQLKKDVTSNLNTY